MMKCVTKMSKRGSQKVVAVSPFMWKKFQFRILGFVKKNQVEKAIR